MRVNHHNNTQTLTAAFGVTLIAIASAARTLPCMVEGEPDCIGSCSNTATLTVCDSGWIITNDMPPPPLALEVWTMTLLTPWCQTFTPKPGTSAFWQGNCDEDPAPPPGYVKAWRTGAGCGTIDEDKCCFLDPEHVVPSQYFLPASGVDPVPVPVHSQPCGMTPPPPPE